MILKCICTHKVQDEMYGAGKRVCNPCNKSSGNEHRCTVCAKLVTPGQAATVDKSGGEK